MNEPAFAELSILFIILGCVLFFLIFVYGIVCYLLYLSARALPEHYRGQVSPGQAFLLIIPLFNYFWLFIYTKNLSQAYQSHFLSVRDPSRGDCGEQLGLWWAITSVGALVPLVGSISGLASLVIMIMYLIKMMELRGHVLSATNYVQPHDGWSREDGGPDEQNPYRP